MKSENMWKYLKMNKDKLKYYIALSYLDCSPLTKVRIFEYFNHDIKRAFKVTKEDISRINELYNSSIRYSVLDKISKLDIEKCFCDALNLKGINVVVYEDEQYPPLLREIPDYPLSLYYLGDIKNMDYEYPIAIVGSRNASCEAQNALNYIVSDLKNSNLTVVSGLAYGIDATAHQAALNNNLKTIAVIGTGLDIQYPYQNKKLYSDILASGGVIFSEFPLKTQAVPYNFPQRNRIVVGMSAGTLVAEARIKSGAMISANLALDYNRELMCMPGNILNPNTKGIYHLIENGASVITKGEDIINTMNWDIQKTQKENVELNDFEKRIINTLEIEPKTFDDIALSLNEKISDIMISLTELELKGLIKQKDNKYYKLY